MSDLFVLMAVNNNFNIEHKELVPLLYSLFFLQPGHRHDSSSHRLEYYATNNKSH